MLAPQKLAMGQTYEQLDKGEEGRLGKSKFTLGEEAAPIHLYIYVYLFLPMYV